MLLLYTIPYSVLCGRVRGGLRTVVGVFSCAEDGCRGCPLTSRSHSALSTFSSKLVSTRLPASLGMVESTSLCSIVTGMLSSHFEVEDRPAESVLERGGGEDDFGGSRGMWISGGDVGDSSWRLVICPP